MSEDEEEYRLEDENPDDNVDNASSDTEVIVSQLSIAEAISHLRRTQCNCKRMTMITAICFTEAT